MADPAEFLTARLAEDEAMARTAAQVAGPDWTWKTEVPDGYDEPTDYVTSMDGALLLDTMGGIEGEAPHVARHDPARVLREVEAKRKILAMYRDAKAEASSEVVEWMLAVVETEARVYSDHPDFDQEWV